MAKGAYDIGRKALYLVIVVIIIIIAFTYMDVAIGNFRIKTYGLAGDLENFVVLENVIKCISKEENGILKRQEIDYQKLEFLESCLNTKKPIKVEILGKEKEILWQTSLNNLKRIKWESKNLVIYNGNLAVLEVGME